MKEKINAGRDVLDKLEKISEKAKEKVRDPGVFTPTLDITGQNINVVRAQTNEKEKRSKLYAKLALEPLITVVYTETENGEHRTYYFSRDIEMTGIARYFTYYQSPVGRLASLEPGDDFTNPVNGEVLYVKNKIDNISPQKLKLIWDSAPTRFLWQESVDDEITVESIESLRGYIETNNIEPDAQPDPWQELENQETDSQFRLELRDGGLRDQKTLDKTQDDIFRLPIDSRLMLSGPPGSGKTTTLIKRIRNKTNLEDLVKEETAAILPKIGDPDQHESSWLIFTPNESLSYYLTEAFNRENVNITQEQRWTWASYSRRYARETGNILSKSSSQSGFTLNETSEHLKKDWDKLKWYSDIRDFTEKKDLEAVKKTIDQYLERQPNELQTYVQRVKNTIDETGDIARIISSIVDIATPLTNRRKEINSNWQDTIERRLDRFSRLKETNARELNKIRERIESSEEDDNQEDTDEEEFGDISEELLQEGSTIQTQSTKDKILRLVRQALRAQANARINKRKITPKYVPLLDFIGDEILNEEQLLSYGADLQELKLINSLLSLVRQMLFSFPRRYREFRKEFSEAYYTSEKLNNNLNQIELDALIALQLEKYRYLIENISGINMENTIFSSLKNIAEEIRNQIFVDEATDFSCFELKAMYLLTNHKLNSFFACGDFDQRLTRSGVTNQTELSWAVPDIKKREIENIYRQSQLLTRFVDMVREIWLKSTITPSSSKYFQAHKGVYPAIFEAKGDQDNAAQWIAERIKDIDRKHRELPSIAILMPNKDKMSLLEENLKRLLPNYEISVHKDADSVGSDTQIRIFPIQNVKGFEFEAAFFFGVDTLEKEDPEMFERYVYVGSTRAATYLAFIAEETIPSVFRALDQTYATDWS